MQYLEPVTYRYEYFQYFIQLFHVSESPSTPEKYRTTLGIYYN